ncbi:ComEC/Rec2 family competence protein [Cardiobacteriaceae bacterium TAE3-ERU3]|nr:ComEC/Rec2 family competence protein [Cardiobacteriaceae bacterium TAE3-ERU3]
MQLSAFPIRTVLFAGLVCAFLYFSYWRSNEIAGKPLSHTTQICTVTFSLKDFPRFYPPRTHAFPAAILSSDNCPFLTGQSLDMRSYSNQAFEPQFAYAGSIKLKPDAGRRVTLLEASVTTNEAGWPMRWRAKLSQRIDQHYGRDSARWLNALLLGNRTELSQQDRDMLRRSGTSHLLAISGLHLGLFALMVYGISAVLWALLWRLRYIAEPRTAALLVMMLSGLLFVLLSGGQAPVWRAWLMLVCVCSGWFLPMVRSPMSGLVIAAVIILLFDPVQLRQPGAWLSFMATAIVILAWQRWKACTALGLWVRMQTVITLVLLPVTWAIFGGISIVGFIVNLLVIPWLAPLWVVCALGALWQPFAAIGSWAVAHYLGIIAFFASADWAYVYPKWQPNLFSGICGFAVMMLIIFAKGRYKLLAVGPLMGIIAQYFYSPEHEIYYLPSQDKVVLLREGRQAVLINAGYRHRSGADDAKRYLMPQLRHHGAGLRAIILTQNNIRTSTALKTWLTDNPTLPIYSIKPVTDLPYYVTYCPKSAVSGVVFKKDTYGCTAEIFGRWVVTANGISEMPR